MRTRNAENPKSATVKKTPPSKKAAPKTPTNPPQAGTESITPKSTETKRASASKMKQVKNNDTTTPNSSTDLKPESAVEEVKASADAFQKAPETKVVSGTKTTKSVVKKTPARTKTPASSKAVSRQKPKSGETGKAKVEEFTKKEEVGNAKDIESAKMEESTIANAKESANKEAIVENVEETTKDDDNVTHVEEPLKKEELAVEVRKEQPLATSVGKSPNQEDHPFVSKDENHEPSITNEEDMREEIKGSTAVDNKMEPNDEPVNMEEDINEESKGDAAKPEVDECHGEGRTEEYGDQEVLEAFGEEELAEDDVPEHGEEAGALEEEQMELTAAAEELKIKKELEIFVGGLDRDAVEEDVKKAFEKIGEVVEVRLHKNSSTNKNKGYAFVKFATKEQASRALSEMKNPLIRGKRCGTALSEDNDTLFLGNICNTWTKEAIKQKLKDYGIDGVEKITLVSDAQHEGLSRGFAFLEFSCHADAMLAYKRLQKPDVIFGHPERTAKVAFAEPLREPDPDVMAQVKSVFVDGLPPHWDEERVREQFKGYGDIERIVLARNMSSAKRKDFGFVDFTTHEAAVACIDGLNNSEMGDGNSKAKVKVRLSNPLPKTQAVKGGMCGGFRIGHGPGSSSNYGRGAYPFNRANFQRGRGFYQSGRGQTGRMGFSGEHNPNGQYPPFQGRQMFGRGGRRGSFGGAHLVSGGSIAPARSNLDRTRHGVTDRGRGRHFLARRQPFPPEERFNRPFIGRHFEDPYFYDDAAHGIKRPFFMTDQDPDYMEPSRLRPRLDYSDPAVPFGGSQYRDAFGGGSGLYSHDYYGSDYGGTSYSSFYEGDRPYGGGYYY